MTASHEKIAQLLRRQAPLREKARIAEVKQRLKGLDGAALNGEMTARWGPIQQQVFQRSSSWAGLFAQETAVLALEALPAQGQIVGGIRVTYRAAGSAASNELTICAVARDGGVVTAESKGKPIVSERSIIDVDPEVVLETIVDYLASVTPVP
jgi:hypothetical protein